MTAGAPAAVSASSPPGLRQRAAVGTVVNALFLTGMNGLTMARGFIAAGFLAASQYGVWGVLTAVLGTMFWLKELGISDKYVQQDESDQELAYQRAFTLELVVTLILTVTMLVALPIFALALNQKEIIKPGIVLAAAIPAMAFQSAIWIHYRRLDFVRQRSLQAIDPVVGFMVTVALAVAGAGYWSLVAGAVAGAWATAIAALLRAPYPIRLRFDRRVAREYIIFSWPLFVGSVSGLAIVHASIFAANSAAGLAGVGVLAVANSITRYAGQVDVIISDTLYPAICRVRDRLDVLYESFVKSNRLVLMGALPIGLGFGVFAPDFVHFIIGDQWSPGIRLMQAIGVLAGVSQIGFNWTAYLRAVGDTRPLAFVGMLTAATFVVAVFPLSHRFGLDGFALASAIMIAVHMAARSYFLRRLFPEFRMWRHGLRAILPVLPALAIVGLLRLVEGGGRDEMQAVIEVCCFVGFAGLGTWVLERALIREVLSYLTGRHQVQSSVV